MKLTAGLLVAPVCWGFASIGSAADTAPASDAASGPAIEEITITARKVEESQQSVPVSVNALSGKDLEQDVVLNVQDLQEHISFPVPQNGHNLFEREFRSKAVYSQLDYALTSQLTATLGARYNWDSGSLIDSQRVSKFVLPDPTGSFYSGACQTLILSAYPNINPATCTANTSASWRAPSLNFTLTDHFADRSMAYAKVSAGYQAGGFNNQIEESNLQAFQPEKATEYELGVKSDWRLLGRPVRTNLDVFHGISHDKQEVENGAYANGSQFVGVFNAGSLAYSGLDAEAVAYVTDVLEFSADWTHVQAKYNSFNFPAVGLLPATNLTGAAPAQIPRDTLAVGTTVTWPLSPMYGQLSTLDRLLSRPDEFSRRGYVGYIPPRTPIPPAVTRRPTSPRSGTVLRNPTSM